MSGAPGHRRLRTNSARAVVVAVDLGASSGRVARVDFDGSALEVSVIQRFVHQPRTHQGVLRWDMGAIRRGVDAGLAAVAGIPDRVRSIGVDTWGVDYGLLRPDGRLAVDPASYRGDPGAAAFQRVVAERGAGELFAAGGVVPMSINTAFQLIAETESDPQRLAGCERLLLMPDLVHNLLCAAVTSERTIASTTGLFDQAAGGWNSELVAALGLPQRLLPQVVEPGTDIGALATGHGGALAGARIVTPASHDTASAVVATPLAGRDEVFLSSGTWSLVGRETAAPAVSSAALSAGVTNELGFGGSVLTMVNVTGLWLLQSCQRAWAARGTETTFDGLTEAAAREPAGRWWIDPDAPDFTNPTDMPEAIRAYCVRTAQGRPETVGEIARTVFDSLAVRYARAVEELQRVTASPEARAVVVVGGGARNRLLCQLTADATGLPVRTGSPEASALGNGAVQLLAAGEFADVDEIREAVRTAEPGELYLPAPGSDGMANLDAWEAVRQRAASSTPAIDV